MNDPFARLGAAMSRARWFVVAIWLAVIIVAGALLAPRAGSVLKAGGITDPDSESSTATEILDREFNASTLNNTVVVFRSETLTVQDPAFQAEVTSAAQRMATAEGVQGVVTFFETGDPRLVSADGHTTVAIVPLEGDEGEALEHVEGVREQLEGLTLEHYVTATPAINHDFQVTSEEDLQRAELFTLPLVLILLVITFRTLVAAAIPLILGGISVIVALSVLFIVGRQMNISIFALNVASMIGLGLGIDFSLIIVGRFREELKLGRSPHDAVQLTMATAGRSITYSGITVLLGMGLLTLIVNLLVVRSISFGVALVALTGLIAGLTFLPAVLAILGHRIERLRVVPRGKPKGEDEGVWYRFSHAIMAHPWIWLIGTAAILILLAWPVLQMDLIGSDPRVIPTDKESSIGAIVVNESFGANELTPVQIAISTDQPGGVWTPEFLNALAVLTDTMAEDDRVDEADSFTALVRGPIPIEDLVPPGVTLTELIHARVDQLPTAPAFVGFGRVTIPAGHEIPMTATEAVEVVLVEAGQLTVQVNGPASLRRGPIADGTTVEEPAPVGTTFVLNQGDQLVIPIGTPASINNDGPDETNVIVFSSYIVTPIKQVGTTNWTEGDTTGDLFRGLPRQVFSAGVATTLPTNPVEIILDHSFFEPGAGVPGHEHPGPELVYVESGNVSLFTGPPNEMTLARIRGEDAPPNQWLELEPGDSGLAQQGALNLAKNNTDEQAVVLSMLVLEIGKPPAPIVFRTSSPEALPALEELKPEVFTFDPRLAAATGAFVNVQGNNDTAIVTLVSRFGQYDDEHQQLVEDLRNDIIPGIEQLDPYTVVVGGSAATFIDFREALYGRFPYLVAAVLVMTFLILMMFFHSLLLPLKAIILNLFSILATYGVLVLIFQHDQGADIFQFESLGAISVVTPVILFVILFSLSTDYEVFMLSRVKEYYHQLGDNEEAVAKGLQHTAGVITAAGLLLIVVFASFATAGIITIKEIGLGLAIGILIDSTIVRVIMVPATMRLMGDWNWWMPGWLGRIVPELSEGPAPELIPPAAPAYGTPALAGAEGWSGPQPAMGVPSSVGFQPQQHWEGAQQTMHAQLRPTNNSLGVDVIPLNPNRPLTIGRDESNVLQLFDVRISRFHARIEQRNNQYVVIDLNSSNGVIVNQRRIEPEPATTPLRHGDLIEIGNFGLVAFAYEEVVTTF